MHLCSHLKATSLTESTILVGAASAKSRKIRHHSGHAHFISGTQAAQEGRLQTYMAAKSDSLFDSVKHGL